MFTVCPKCALTLVVTAADLRIAQGYVRCGRCSSVFNALARLTDDRQAAESLSEAQQPAAARSESARLAESKEPSGDSEAPGEESHGGTHDEAPRQPLPHDDAPYDETPRQAVDFSAQPEAPAADEHAAPPAPADTPSPKQSVPMPVTSNDEEAIPEGALEFDPVTTDVAAVFIEPPPDPAWAAATGTFKAMMARAPASADEESSVEGSSVERSTVGGSSVQESTVDGSSVEASSAEQSSLEGTTLETSRAAGTAQRPAPGDEPDDSDLTAGVDLIDESAHGERPAEARGRARIWAVAAGIASLFLLAQVVHHHRDDLAVRAAFNRPLTALYAALGIPLVPRWDVRAYDVRQLGAVAGPATAGLITVRASIKNAARQAQPLPMLRVTLQDR
ncbi:MAG: zinc-ribbon and DUF3426 domain-containing protein, partial [Gammaproteobacteria bacterium]|nr:zinc-ribbon and DUF3426 domain-containing protein [Gammaproteobacteria bacterium]